MSKLAEAESAFEETDDLTILDDIESELGSNGKRIDFMPLFMLDLSKVLPSINGNK